MKNDSDAFWGGDSGFYVLAAAISGNLPPNYRCNRGHAASELAQKAIFVSGLGEASGGWEAQGWGVPAGIGVPADAGNQNL
ncbi:hypothetical protein [Microbulbifer sp. Q7]|uniref:hypothetical protein n=1 Tax=Microbulbifer sp. Q7 TaxID=1785091 RepID=UPI000837171B|nr:hypothetical protein [Microbulbifer sp. Q7]